MLCAVSTDVFSFVVCLADNGVVHSFGFNNNGPLGLGQEVDQDFHVGIPTRIQNLPKIISVSCGIQYVVCVDEEGFMWSFGSNNHGQLGTGNKNDYNTPQKITNLPPIHTVSCGGAHTLILTKDSNLWSCGSNKYGQLCFQTLEKGKVPTQTPFSNITKICGGGAHSLFQNTKGEIFGCGANSKGQLSNERTAYQLIAFHIPLQGIIQMCCGQGHSLFLDKSGKVFSAGYNKHGSLGSGTRRSHSIHQIENIPFIKKISCVENSSYLIDENDNLWCFGRNDNGQLGIGNTKDSVIPVKNEYVKNIQQIASGSYGNLCMVKSLDKKIYAMGDIAHFTVINKSSNNGTPVEIDSNYFSIWGSPTNTFNTIQSLTKDDLKKIELLQSKIDQVKASLPLNSKKNQQEHPQLSFDSWKDVHYFLNNKLELVTSELNQIEKKSNNQVQNVKKLRNLEKELLDIDIQIENLQKRRKEIEEYLSNESLEKSSIEFDANYSYVEKNQQILQEMCDNAKTFWKNENEINQQIQSLFEQKTFDEFDCSDISNLLWKMDLIKYQPVFEENQINGKFLSSLIDDVSCLKLLGLEERDCYYAFFYFQLMKSPGYYNTFSDDYEEECFVCSHNTPQLTIHLLNEYDISISKELILSNNICSPILTFPSALKELNIDLFSEKGREICFKLTQWNEAHKEHLKQLNQTKSKKEK